MSLLPARRHTRAGRRGQALVEFAMILPILALLLVMAVDFGRVFFGWVSIHNAARIGASYAAAHPDAWTPPLGEANKATQRALYATKIQNDLQAINCVFGGVDDPNFDDANGNGAIDSGELARVELECSFGLITPLAEGLMGGTVDLAAAAEFPAHRTILASLPDPPPPPPPPTCEVPLMEGSTRTVARSLWTGASFQLANLVEDGSGNFLVATQSVSAGSEIPCTSSVTISEGATGPTPSTCEEPTAGFVADATSGDSPLEVQFTDQSTSPGCPLTWLWTFSNGLPSSNLQHPTQVFTHSGNGNTKYTVTLTVTNDAGTDTRTRNNYITVTDR